MRNTRRKSHHKRAAEELAARMLANGGSLKGYMARHGANGLALYVRDRRELDRLHCKGRD